MDDIIIIYALHVYCTVPRALTVLYCTTFNGPVTGILVLKILVRGTKIFNLLAENFGPGPKFSIANPEKNGPPLKILVRVSGVGEFVLTFCAASQPRTSNQEL